MKEFIQSNIFMKFTGNSEKNNYKSIKKSEKKSPRDNSVEEFIMKKIKKN